MKYVYDNEDYDIPDWQTHQNLLLLESQYGKGLLKKIKEKHLEILKSRPRNIFKFMRDKGDNKIVSINVCRTPINKTIKKVLNLLTKQTLEEVRKKYDYDDVYHLYAVLIFEDNSKNALPKAIIPRILKIIPLVTRISLRIYLYNITRLPTP